ncbi:MAG TPA: hypothetical protein VGE63_00035 [Candidatus Paceibacterota bacterium]
MKLIRTYTHVFFALAILLAVPLASHAQSSTSVDGSSKTNLTNTINKTLNTSVNGKLNTSVDVGVDENGVNVNGNVNSTTNANNQNGQSSTNTDGTMNTTSSANVMSSAQVTTDADFESFTNTLEARDSNVANVDYTTNNDGDSTVSVVYKQRGRFLGIIPVNVRTRTNVTTNADNTVEVKARPAWWSFLVTGKDYSASELEAELQNNATIQANANMNASATSRARVVEAVVDQFETRSEAQADAHVETSTEIQQ